MSTLNSMRLIIICFLCTATSVSALDLDIPITYEQNYAVEAEAEATDQPLIQKRKLIIVVANDGISANLSDRNLTSQLRIGLITKRIPKSLRHYIASNNYLVMTLTHEIYTPDDIEDFELIPDDHPYAGWLYLTFGQLKQSGDTLSVTTVDLGIVGPSAKAESAQVNLHNLIGSSDPNGWQHQLSDELGVNLHRDNYFKNNFTLNNYISAELIKFYGYSLGNIKTNVRVGGLARIGYNVPDDMVIGVNQSPNKNLSVFGYIKAEGKYVLTNIFLDGNTFKESHSVNKENVVAQLTAGITVQKNGWGFSIVQSIQSREYSEQTDPHTNAELRFVFDFFF